VEQNASARRAAAIDAAEHQIAFVAAVIRDDRHSVLA
jgi:hypothetical protein